jgi:hypothetical protein
MEVNAVFKIHTVESSCTSQFTLVSELSTFKVALPLKKHTLQLL